MNLQFAWPELLIPRVSIGQPSHCTEIYIVDTYESATAQTWSKL